MRSVKTVLYCAVAAILYGVVHNQITARLGAEFSVFHLPASSPGLAGGILAAWWIVAGARLLFTVRASSPLNWRASVRNPVSKRLALMVGSAFLFDAI